MKQRKILDIDDNISIEVKGEEVFLEVNGGEYTAKLTLIDLRELRDWISTEVLNEIKPIIRMYPEEVNSIVQQKGPTAIGPLIADPRSTVQPVDLESRRAIVASGGVVDLSKTQGLITKKDELQVMNLSSQIGKAREAFSPENLNKA